ncbi:MAG: starch-binding protein [Clostridia bacterium]
MKRLLCLLLAVCAVFSLPLAAGAEAAAAAAAEEQMVVYAKVPADWAAPCLWAWSEDGKNAFDAWPGGEMDADPANAGWYYCYLPTYANHVIVNANAGAVQTAELQLEGKAWLNIADAENVTIEYNAQTKGEAPAYTEKFTVFAKVPESWTAPKLWAWLAPEGTNAFEAWPGKAMLQNEAGWYAVKAPCYVNSIIVNAQEGKVQTKDIEIDPVNVWLTVAEDGSYELSYNDPDAKAVQNISVYVKVPADWEAPCLWAWSAPDGTNAFKAWPGEPLKADADGWLKLEVPGFINSVIVNGNAGKVQTADIAVEAGKDLYLVVTDAENQSLTYEKPE